MENENTTKCESLISLDEHPWTDKEWKAREMMRLKPLMPELVCQRDDERMCDAEDDIVIWMKEEERRRERKERMFREWDI